MIKIYTGVAGSGKTKAMKKDISEHKKDWFVAIDEGDYFLKDNPNFNLEQFLNNYKDLFITLQNQRVITKQLSNEQMKFVEIKKFQTSNPKE